MYRQNRVTFGFVLLMVLLILRIVFNEDQVGVNFLSFLGLIPMVILAIVFMVLGVYLRTAVLQKNREVARYILNFFMFIILIEMVVWVGILFTSSPGLTGIFIPWFFLPYAYFFITNNSHSEEPKYNDIFEYYETESEDVDIFEDYLNNQNKDRFHNE